MSLPAPLLDDSRDLLFADWAEPVTLRQIAATYDPETGHLAESQIDTPLLAIPGPSENAATPQTAHQHSTRERTFLLRAGDLPAPLTWSTSRLLHAGDEYTLLSVNRSALSDLILFHGRTAH